MSGAVELSVIIVSHGHERMLPACIDALRLGLAGLTAEIIVIDNLQSGAVGAALRGAAVRLVENKAPVGFAANVNSGAAIAVGSRILLLNHEKFGRSALHALAPLTAFDAVLTGTALPAAEACALKAAGVRLHLIETDTP